MSRQDEPEFLADMTKGQLIQKILRINPSETERHLRSLSKGVLINHVNMYRRYNIGVE